jgi:UDP-N-acetylmuramyl tripeptide synthase
VGGYPPEQAFQPLYKAIVLKHSFIRAVDEDGKIGMMYRSSTALLQGRIK